LPPLRFDDSKFDIDKLENVPFIKITTTKKYFRRVPEQKKIENESNLRLIFVWFGFCREATTGAQPTKKKKRKRHNKKPKNYDPNVPPGPVHLTILTIERGSDLFVVFQQIRNVGFHVGNGPLTRDENEESSNLF
jgi:hypothetical protein